MLTHSIAKFGEYCVFLWRSVSIPEKWREFFKNYRNEIYKLGIDSIPLILIISVFIGALCTILIKMEISNPLLPRYSLGLTTREIIILEFSSTILCLILSGKIGSNIASEIGTMRVTEQIDAMETMAVNPVQYLVVPRFIAGLVMVPALCALFTLVGMIGSYFVGVVMLNIDEGSFLSNVYWLIDPKDLSSGLIKACVFGGMLTLIGCFKGFYATGGARGVGIATTQSVVASSVLILISDYFLTAIMF